MRAGFLRSVVYHLIIAVFISFPARAQVRPVVKTIGELQTTVWQPEKTEKNGSPLIIFSHGFRGWPAQSSFLTESLAAAGYLVIAPEHRDSGNSSRTASASGKPAATPEKWNEETYIDRREDITALIKTLQESGEWKGRIDWSRFGLAGYSLGGYTVLALAGAWPSWRLKDPGPRAVLALSPYSEPFAIRVSLRGISAAVMYQGGTRDSGMTPVIKRSGGVFDLSLAPAWFVEFDGAGHLAWTDQSGALHNDIRHYSIGFMNRYLRDGKTPDITTKSPAVAALKFK